MNLSRRFLANRFVANSSIENISLNQIGHYTRLTGENPASCAFYNYDSDTDKTKGVKEHVAAGDISQRVLSLIFSPIQQQMVVNMQATIANQLISVLTCVRRHKCQ